MREQFIDRTFQAATLNTIALADTIIAEYQGQGFVLTLRQLYYQFVARGHLPNKQSEYKRLGSIINDARLAGLLDWSAIEDRTRNLATHAAWGGVADIIAAAAQSFRLNPWLNQDVAPEVWIEKEALTGVIEPVCDRWRVPYFACRGYTSQSEQYRAGDRFKDAFQHVRRPLVLHLGDHDPSGIDMTRDNADRLALFARHDVEVKRLALNFDQVQEHNPPPNPAKETDSRHAGYAARFGDESWELDALNPQVIDGLIDAALKEIVNDTAWNETMEREDAARATLAQACDRWDAVTDFLNE